MQEIKLDASMIRNELQEKLKNLKKFEQSESFSKIKSVCEKEIDELSVEFDKELAKRKTKKKAHEIIYSDLDKYLLHKEYLELLLKNSECKEYTEEMEYNLSELDKNIKFRFDYNKEKSEHGGEYFFKPETFDKPIYSELDAIKFKINFRMGVEQELKNIISSNELQGKGIDVDELTNAYATPKSEPIGEMEV